MRPTVTMDRVEMRMEEKEWHRMRYGRIPINVHYLVGDSSGKVRGQQLDEKNPAIYLETPNLTIDGSHSTTLSVFLHRSIPSEFLESVLYHELVEAEMRFVDGLQEGEAHRKAVKFEQEYAKKFHGEEMATQFLSWRNGLDRHSS